VTANPPARVSATEKMPGQVFFIVGNEACERFSYYGVIAILTLYVTRHLGQGDSAGHKISHFFKAGVYFTPLIGAWISDRWLGRYRTILYISLFYCAGHGVMAMADLTHSVDSKLTILYTGLTLLAFGGGGIKPCVSAFMGDQFRAATAGAVQRAYALFYWSINLGSTFAFLAVPQIAAKHGYGWAFGVPGIFMALATVIFWSGRRRYLHVPPSRNTSGGFWEMLGYALIHQSDRRPGKGFWDACHRKYSESDLEGARAASRVAGVFALIPFFWALYDQSNSTWVTQGARMIPYPLPDWLRWALGWMLGDTLGAEQMQAMNAIQILFLVPFYSYLLFPGLERLGLRVTTLRRMSVGLFLTAASFVWIALLQHRLDAGEKISVVWQFWPYFILSAGEVLVSNTGLEFAFREAPRKMRSTLMSFWLLTVAAGNLGVAKLVELNVRSRNPDGAEILYVSGENQFWLYSGLLALVGIAFVFVAMRYTYRPADEPEGELHAES
jgi:POT family proton-dependent oligopeptide transporter